MQTANARTHPGNALDEARHGVLHGARHDGGPQECERHVAAPLDKKMLRHRLSRRVSVHAHSRAPDAPWSWCTYWGSRRGCPFRTPSEARRRSSSSLCPPSGPDRTPAGRASRPPSRRAGSRSRSTCYARRRQGVRTENQERCGCARGWHADLTWTKASKRAHFLAISMRLRLPTTLSAIALCNGRHQSVKTSLGARWLRTGRAAH
jgi:hypothetical protein